MNKTRHKKHSLFKKIIIPLIAVILLESVIFFAATFYGGVSDTINKNAENVLTERVINQRNTVETLFTNQWTDFSLASSGVSAAYTKLSDEFGHPIYEDINLQKQLLSQTVDILIKTLRKNEVTGVFLILNDSKESKLLQEGTSQSKYGVCIRDYAPTSQYTDQEDLLAVRCPSAMVSTIGCSVETWWDALFTFDESTPGDYFYKPLQMAYENPGTDNTNLTYFDTVHSFGQSDRPVVSYSIPLMDSEGYPYAVLGIELTTDYLKTLISSSSLYADNAGCYALVQYEEGTNTFDVITYNGVLYQQCHGSMMSFQANVEKNGMIRGMKTQQNQDCSGNISNLQIYNQNTPYENQKVALIGMVKNSSLYGVNSIVRNRLVGVSIFVMVMGFVAVLIISRKLTNPINKLSQKVQTMEGDKTLKLDRLNIDEIDGLVESIEGLNDKVNRTAIRMEFFSRMSHDMRTPMNAIIGFSSPELLENSDEKTMREYMEKINSSGNFLLALINEVLDMAKIETQKMELNEQPIRQENVLEAVVPIIREVAKEKNIRFEVEADYAKTLYYGDRQKMSQVLMNLLSNAVKFTPKDGTVFLQVEEIYKDENEVTSRIVVRDSGIGMSEEFQKIMYEPFLQEQNGNGGTGLGLSIARQMVSLMGGNMTCESEKEKGTVFTVNITSKLVKESEVIVSQEHKSAIQESRVLESAGETNSLAGKRILLCEDHPLNAQIATSLLERCQMIVETASDGAQGFHMFDESIEGYYDLILMDIRMPVMTGLEATRKIRSLGRRDAKNIPIIAMTANAFKEDMQESADAGMNEHLSKPIDPKVLYETLKKYLRT